MKNIVTIGGGTGTFAMLSALRRVEGLSLTAIVTTADDGGSTGHLRDAYGFLPAGDARQALVALAEDGDVLRDLFAYRFTKSDLAGHSLGNLFITALTDMLGSNVAALTEASRILRICGSVVPATKEPSVLVATLSDGSIIRTEHEIDAGSTGRCSIESVTLNPLLPVSTEAVTAVENADYIILGPGDLYTSSIAALLPEGMKTAVSTSKAKIIYVSNLFTKAGQTEGYTLSKHVEVLTSYAGREADSILVHEGVFSPEVVAWYAKEEEFQVPDDLLEDLRVIRTELASVHVVPPLQSDPVRRSLMRHDPELVANAFRSLLT